MQLHLRLTNKNPTRFYGEKNFAKDSPLAAVIQMHAPKTARHGQKCDKQK
jgi:hypothetical protein